jgi:predicted MarR family transcription regulator
LAADRFRADVDQLGRVARGLGECVEETGNVVRSLHGGADPEFTFGISPEGERASAEYRSMRESLQDMVIGMRDLGQRHREALESVVRLYRRVDGDATALAGLPAEDRR